MNRFNQPKEKHSNLKRTLSSGVIFAAGITVLMFGLSSVSDSAESSQAESLRLSITRSAVHCYAMEGRYPESLDYLKEHYGIEWDPEKYTVDYEIFGSNMMPTVTVITQGGF